MAIKAKFTSPISKENFINYIENTTQEKKQQKSQKITITLTTNDVELMEKQIDRAITLGKRTKGRSGIIKIALLALSKTSDDNYLKLYQSN